MGDSSNTRERRPMAIWTRACDMATPREKSLRSLPYNPHRQHRAMHDRLPSFSSELFPFRSTTFVTALEPRPKRIRKSEEATRQQGDLFFRENSSNGGKAIRTFWRNTKFGKNRCQG